MRQSLADEVKKAMGSFSLETGRSGIEGDRPGSKEMAGSGSSKTADPGPWKEECRPKKILAAVSGGADSVCLLLVLLEIGYEVQAVHVEHGIRGEESLEDCAYVRRLCEERKIPLRVVSVDAPAAARQFSTGLEEAARDLRGKALRDTAHELGIDVIATAHHRMDQAETVLWNLIRGSSVRGLGGIRPCRREKDLTIIRPLLGCDRNRIEDYLRQKGVSWRSDSTNQDVALTRNAIRLKILPLLEELNPGAARHIAQAASDLRKVDDWLLEQEDEAWERVILEEGDGREKDLTADRDMLRRCSEVIRLRILRRMIARCCGGEKDISRAHVEAADRLVFDRNGQETSLPGDLLAVSEEGILRLTRSRTLKTETVLPLDGDGVYCFPVGRKWLDYHCTGTAEQPETDDEIMVEAAYLTWQGGEVPKKKYTKVLAYDTMAPCPVLRTRREGDYLIVNASRGRRKLKDYLIDEKVPRRERDQIPLIAQGSHVLWVTGMRISEGAKVTEGSKALQVQVYSAKTAYTANMGMTGHDWA